MPEASVIEIYLADPQREIRRLMRSALRDIQLNVSEDYEDCGPFREAVREGAPDLIIIDAELTGGDACSLVRAIRHHRLGPNPFIPIIVTSWVSTAAHIRELIDSGADGLLIKPISIETVQRHIDLIVNKRKPFVVTSSYIGPDRRKDPERTSTVPLIDVPNTLRAKISGEPIDWLALQQQIASLTVEINAERLRRNAFELSFLVELTLSSFDANVSDSELRSNITRLQTVAMDTTQRLAGSVFAQSADLCRTLLRVVTSLVDGDAKPARVDLQLLKPLTDAILVGFNPDRNAAAMTQEIIASIGTFEARQKTWDKSD
ncbi:MAG: response regulator [Alphaproteobacteria bacterium]|nr:response regulator [Alphaproteobacteria bacterium]